MAYISNFSNYSQEEYGFPFPGKGNTGFYIPGIQKSSINTVGDPCMNPFGGVSNLNCPDWDPSCNCIITQYMPTKPEPENKTLIDLKKSINECSLIKDKLGIDWMGIDYTDPYADYNCPNCIQATTPPLKEKLIEAFKLKKNDEALQGYTGPYPYSLGLSGISGVSLAIEYDPKEPTDTITQAPWKCTGNCFKYYLEYSKTNATFWNTPPNTPLLRKSQIALYNAQKIKILVHGDSRIYVGQLINIQFPVNGDPFHKRFCGRWMIYRIERVVTTKKHTMFLYLMRDGHAYAGTETKLDLATLTVNELFENGNQTPGSNSNGGLSTG